LALMSAWSVTVVMGVSRAGSTGWCAETRFLRRQL